jgi:purine nucleosidase
MPTSIILDCDPGIDDALAIAFAHGHPGIDLLGITTVAGNVGLAKTTANALAVCEYIGAAGTPVTAGCAGPLLRPALDARQVHGESGLGGAVLPPPVASPAPGHAIDYITETVRAAPGQITLVATGPLTNIALAVKREPRLTDWVRRFVIMGGSAGRGNTTPAAEYNIWADPEAARIVLQSGIRELVVVPLDATHEALVTGDECDQLEALGTPAGTAAASLIRRRIEGYAAIQPPAIPNSAPVHDALCVAYLIEPDVIATREAHVDVELNGELTRGRTVVDLRPIPLEPPNARWAYGADRALFLELLLGAFA